MAREMFALFPPLKEGGNIDTVEFDEPQLPRTPANFTVDIPPMSGAIVPIREMVNFISEEIDRGDANPKPPGPYIAPS